MLETLKYFTDVGIAFLIMLIAWGLVISILCVFSRYAITYIGKRK